MASKNPPKMDLMAICRLEFYRKQKNWKFCSEERRGKEPKRRAKGSNNLNKTYNIEPRPEKEEPEVPQDPGPDSPNLESLDPESPNPEEPVKPDVEDVEEYTDLNEAFVETETGIASELDEPPENLDNLNVGFEAESDNNPASHLDPLSSPYSPRWSIQRWAEQRRLWNPESTYPPAEPVYPQPQTYEPIYPNLENNYINQNFYQDCDNRLYFAYNPNCPSEPSCPCHDRYMQEPLNHKLGVNVVYYNSNMCHGDVGGEELAPEWEAAVAALPTVTGTDRVDGGSRTDDLFADIQELSRCDSLSSVTSDEFVRGAALAPHSTQIDLFSTQTLPELALARAVARHSAALRQLLDEARRRQQCTRHTDVAGAGAVADGGSPLSGCLGEALRRQQCPLSGEPYIDEIPVRDPGPMGPVYHPPSAAFVDSVVAGSHKNRPDLWGHTDLGRGRGRLKVIGIGMGRPYRL